MPLSSLPALLLSIFLVGYSPGPANVFALAMVVRYGRRAALRMWLGLFAGYASAALVCVLLVHFLGVAIGEWIGILKYIGAAYLLWLAVRVYRTRGASEEERRGCTFANGFIVQFTNAKIILYELTVYATFVLPHSTRILDLLAVAALLSLAGPGANLAWLLAGSFLRRCFLRYRSVTDCILAILLAGCALWVLFA